MNEPDSSSRPALGDQLSDAEIEILRAGGIDLTGDDEDPSKYEEMVAESTAWIRSLFLSVDKAAERLSIDASEVERMCEDGFLVAERQTDSWSIPAWQIIRGDGNRYFLLERRRDVDAAGRKADRDAVTIATVMNTPQRELAVGDVLITPVQWLEQGRDVRTVLQVMSSDPGAW